MLTCNIALLGLPEAQRLTPEVTRLEQDLVHLTVAIVEQRLEDDRLLQEISTLSAKAIRCINVTNVNYAGKQSLECGPQNPLITTILDKPTANKLLLAIAHQSFLDPSEQCVEKVANLVECWEP